MKLDSNHIQLLDRMEKADLFAFSHTTTCRALYKLMENLVVEARDEAMSVEPDQEKLQKAKMDTAHAMAKFYTRLRKEIETAASEHRGELQELANQEILGDRDVMEQIILDQSVNPLSYPSMLESPRI